MARPRKSRMICTLPKVKALEPISGESDLENDMKTDPEGGQGGGFKSDLKDSGIVMGLDEYEAIRLIDLLGCTQEECARQMGVARTTVQLVYESARKKLASVLVEGNRLSISGGDYTVCVHSRDCCKKNCDKRMNCQEKCEKIQQACGSQWSCGKKL